MQGSGLTPKQLKAITALLANPTLKGAAAECGVNEATLWRWLQNDVFRRAYSEARSRLLESTLTALQAAGTKAVETLTDVMEGAVLYPSARVSAARTVLEMGLKAREILEVEERLAALEERFNKGGANGSQKTFGR